MEIEEEDTDSRGSRICGRRWIIAREGKGKHFEGDHGEVGCMGKSSLAKLAKLVWKRFGEDSDLTCSVMNGID